MLYRYCRSATGNKESLEKQIEWAETKWVTESNIYIDSGSGLDKNREELKRLLVSTSLL